MYTSDEHLAARDALLRMFFAVDRRDWDSVRTALADTVDLDYTSLNGGEPGALPADELVTAWRSVLPGFDATHHHLSVVTSSPIEDDIQVVANGTATHRLADSRGESLWTVAGYYEAVMRPSRDGWQISSLTFQSTWGSGNQALAQAAQRVVEGRDQEPA